MKRIFDLEYNDFMNYSKSDLLETIKQSEGRTVMAETVISVMPLLDGVANAETASAFGADMVTLNAFDFANPFIFGFDDLSTDMFGGIAQYGKVIEEKIKENRKNAEYVQEFKSRVGRFVGVNMEPVPKDIPYPDGMRLSEKNIKGAQKLGFDYVVVTANPKTNIGSDDIIQGIQLIRETVGDDLLIIAGKMHGAGAGNIYSEKVVEDFVTAGADVVLIPSPGTVPGYDFKLVQNFIQLVHKHGSLAMSTIGTSQEGATESVIEEMALDSKKAGADIQHIGDAGYSGMALPENIMTLSIAIRGKRHTYRQISRSKRR